MKTYYTIQCEIEVEASDDDTALAMLIDACKLYPGLQLTRWIDTKLTEREANDYN
jgi:hypothetical protein